MSEIKHLDSASFDAETASGTILVDFWATWCGPCRALLPVLEEVAKELDGKATVAKVNVEESPDLAKRFNVRNLPALFILKDGEISGQLPGVNDKAAIVSAVENA